MSSGVGAYGDRRLEAWFSDDVTVVVTSCNPLKNGLCDGFRKGFFVGIVLAKSVTCLQTVVGKGYLILCELSFVFIPIMDEVDNFRQGLYVFLAYCPVDS